MKNRKARNTLKKGFFFNFFKKHKSIAFSLVVGVGFLGFILTVNYGRYVKDVIESYYLRSQNFYFTSNMLSIHPKEYEINPWTQKLWPIDFSISNALNKLKKTSTNITYTLSCEPDPRIDCYIEEPGVRSQDRVFLSSSTDLNEIIYVYAVPKDEIDYIDGETLSITVKATSTSPYKETLSAVFKLKVGDYTVTHEIEDEVGSVYFNSIVTNALENESDTVTLTIDPKYFDEISFDMMNEVLSLDGTTYTTAIASDGKVYINSVTFTLEPKSSMTVKFYKFNSARDYSYVKGEDKDPAIKFSSLYANSNSG